MAENDTDTLRSEVSQLRSDLSSLTASVRELAARRGEQVYDSVRERVVTTEQHAEEAIRRNPLAAVGAVFGVGFVLGLLLNRRD